MRNQETKVVKVFFVEISFQSKIDRRRKARRRRHDTRQNGIQDNDTQHNDIQGNDTQHNDIQDNDTQHNDIKLDSEIGFFAMPYVQCGYTEYS